MADNPLLKPFVYVIGSFGSLQTNHIRFLQEASRLGRVHVLLLSDQSAIIVEGEQPKFPAEERAYFLESVRYVYRLSIIDDFPKTDDLPQIAEIKTNLNNQPYWVVHAKDDTDEKRKFCRDNGIRYHAIAPADLVGFPAEEPAQSTEATRRKKVMVSGCFDWVHSGHVRFLEEVSAFGDLYVVVGHDANLTLLKGEGHPMFSQEERRYWIQSIRFVKKVLISTGQGWLDAEPEILQIKPDIFITNEDGDKPEKQSFCKKHGVEYRVLKRLPKPGLPARESTALRGY